MNAAVDLEMHNVAMSIVQSVSVKSSLVLYADYIIVEKSFQKSEASEVVWNWDFERNHNFIRNST